MVAILISINSLPVFMAIARQYSYCYVVINYPLIFKHALEITLEPNKYNCEFPKNIKEPEKMMANFLKYCPIRHQRIYSLDKEKK